MFWLRNKFKKVSYALLSVGFLQKYGFGSIPSLKFFKEFNLKGSVMTHNTIVICLNLMAATDRCYEISDNNQQSINRH